MKHLYVIRYGDLTKIGVTVSPASRYSAYRTQARRDGVETAVLFELPRHMEYDQNERATLARFQAPGARSEYLSTPADEVIAFVRALPCTVIPPRACQSDSERWLTRAQVAEMLDCTPGTVDRYAVAGLLARHKNRITARVRFRVEDVRPLLELTR